MYDAKEAVIWGADIPRELLWEILRTPEMPIKYIKLRRAAMSRMDRDGWRNAVRIIQGMGYSVFADAKIIGTTDEVEELAGDYLEQKPWMLNVMAHAESTDFLEHPDPKKIDALKKFADACKAVGTRPCAVTVLTNKTDDVVRREFNERTPGDQVLYYVDILQKAGFTDIVCSPLEITLIRSESRFDHLELNTPGVRLPGSSTEDQNRVGTPRKALKDGANRVVTRSELCKDVKNADDFRERFAFLAAHINSEEVCA